MIVWVYVAMISLGASPVYVASNLKYAFTTEATCKKMIEGLDKLKCIPLELKD